MVKSSLKEKLKKILLFLFNPRLLLCIAIGWMITNGWSYIFIALGTFFEIKWMLYVGGAYMSLLWFPFTPEKLITVAIALFLLKRLFPNDTKSLAVLRDLHASAKEKAQNFRAKRAAKKQNAHGQQDITPSADENHK